MVIETTTTTENALGRFVAKTRELFASEPDLDKRWEALTPILSDLLADPDSFGELERSDQQFAALEAVAATVIADTKAHWHSGFQVCIAAANTGVPDIAAAVATRLVNIKPAGASLPKGFEVFTEILADTGLLETQARAA